MFGNFNMSIYLHSIRSLSENFSAIRVNHVSDTCMCVMLGIFHIIVLIKIYFPR